MSIGQPFYKQLEYYFLEKYCPVKVKCLYRHCNDAVMLYSGGEHLFTMPPLEVTQKR